MKNWKNKSEFPKVLLILYLLLKVLRQWIIEYYIILAT